jgi:hypothetical protein
LIASGLVPSTIVISGVGGRKVAEAVKEDGQTG